MTRIKQVATALAITGAMLAGMWAGTSVATETVCPATEDQYGCEPTDTVPEYTGPPKEETTVEPPAPPEETTVVEPTVPEPTVIESTEPTTPPETTRPEPNEPEETTIEPTTGEPGEPVEPDAPGVAPDDPDAPAKLPDPDTPILIDVPDVIRVPDGPSVTITSVEAPRVFVETPEIATSVVLVDADGSGAVERTEVASQVAEAVAGEPTEPAVDVLPNTGGPSLMTALVLFAGGAAFGYALGARARF